MEAKLQLAPEPAKTLADYPMIARNYSRSKIRFLITDKIDMEDRSRKPKTDWDRKFAHLHLQAIEAELKARKKSWQQ